MSVSRRLRFEILRRDGHACRYCGAKAPDVALTVDHVIPIALGGGDEPNNLVTACSDCNSGKTSMGPDAAVVADVDAAAMLWAKAIERANAERSRHLVDMEALLGRFEDEWRDYTPSSTGIPRPNDWPTSVERFLEHGLSMDELFRFVSIAMGSKAPAGRVWRYFCGCCWNEIAARQELARRIIEDGEV